MSDDPAFVSPRLSQLHTGIHHRGMSALETFWEQVQVDGAPLIEPSLREGEVIVTFLWRETEPVSSVAVISDLQDAPVSAPPDAMTRMKGTNLWYRSYRVRADLRTTYELSPADPLTAIVPFEGDSQRGHTYRVDPLNPRRYLVNLPGDRWEGSAEKYLSVLECPIAPLQPFVAPRPGVPRGAIALHHFRSALLENERRVWVYTPAQGAQKGDRRSLLLLFDGAAYLDIMHAATTLDNLHAEGRVTPLVALFIDNPTATSRFTELACNDSFVRFLADELLPWLRASYRVTDDPSRCIVGGTSMGGLASAFTAFRRPDLFGDVLSQSGAFIWGSSGGHEDEWLTKELELSPRLPLRFYLDAGLLEHRLRRPGGPSLLDANRRLRDVLVNRGYEVTYNEFNGAHNYICWQGTLADGLLALAR